MIYFLDCFLWLFIMSHFRSVVQPWDMALITLAVLIFAGTNFREFLSPYIRGYLFSRMSFYSTFVGTNFREFYRKLFGKICGWHLYFKTPFITENYFKTYQTHSYLLLRQLEEPIPAHPRRHLYHLLVSRIPYTLSTCTNFSCFQLFISEERKEKRIFAGTNFRESVISEIFRGY